MKIKENDEKPVFFKTHAFKRVGRTNQRISTSEIRKLAQEERKRLCFDERICEEASLDAKYERRLELNTDSSVKEALEKLGFEGRKVNKCYNFAIRKKSPEELFTGRNKMRSL